MKQYPFFLLIQKYHYIKFDVIYILCTISLAPPTLINDKLCEVNYKLLHHLRMLKTCILATSICKIFLE